MLVFLGWMSFCCFAISCSHSQQNNSMIIRKVGFVLFDSAVGIESHLFTSAVSCTDSSRVEINNKDVFVAYVDTLLENIMLKSQQLINGKLDFEDSEYNRYYSRFDDMPIMSDRMLILECFEYLNSIRKDIAKHELSETSYIYLHNLWMRYKHLSMFKDSWYRSNPALYFSNDFLVEDLLKNPPFSDVYNSLDELAVCDFIKLGFDAIDTYYLIDSETARDIRRQLTHSTHVEAIKLTELLDEFISSNERLRLVLVYNL